MHRHSTDTEVVTEGEEWGQAKGGGWRGLKGCNNSVMI